MYVAMIHEYPIAIAWEHILSAIVVGAPSTSACDTIHTPPPPSKSKREKKAKILMQMEANSRRFVRS